MGNNVFAVLTKKYDFAIRQKFTFCGSGEKCDFEIFVKKYILTLMQKMCFGNFLEKKKFMVLAENVVFLF